jgi:hypothetical protein
MEEQFVKNNNEIQEILGKVSNLKNEVTRKMEKAIHDMLESIGGSLMIDAEFEELCGDSLMISYDGGKNPEDRSSLYSTVEEIYVNGDDSFAVDLEDENKYEPSRMMYSDISDIYNCLYHYIKYV